MGNSQRVQKKEVSQLLPGSRSYFSSCGRITHDDRFFTNKTENQVLGIRSSSSLPFEVIELTLGTPLSSGSKQILLRVNFWSKLIRFLNNLNLFTHFFTAKKTLFIQKTMKKTNTKMYEEKKKLK